MTQNLQRRERLKRIQMSWAEEFVALRNRDLWKLALLVAILILEVQRFIP